MGNWRVKDAEGTPVDFEDLSCYVTQELGVGKPQITNIITEFGQADGGQFQRNILPPRQFSLVLTLLGSDPDDVQMKRQSLIALFDRRSAQTLQYVRNKTLEISARYNGGLEGDIQAGNYEQIPLQFIAEDPYFVEAGSTTTVTLNVNSNTTVSNDGTTLAWPVIYFAGQGLITGLVNSTTGKSILFELVIFPGEIVTLDLRPGFKTLVSDLLGSRFAAILKGSNLTTFALEQGDNTLLLSASGELAILDEAEQEIWDENNQPILGIGTLDLTTTTLEFDRRHESYDGAV